MKIQILHSFSITLHAKTTLSSLEYPESFLVYTAQVTCSLELVYKYILTHSGTHEEPVTWQCFRQLITESAQ